MTDVHAFILTKVAQLWCDAKVSVWWYWWAHCSVNDAACDGRGEERVFYGVRGRDDSSRDDAEEKREHDAEENRERSGGLHCDKSAVEVEWDDGVKR